MRFLAYDMGASNGRAILGTMENERITLKDIHRFPNNPVMTNNHFHWDTLRLLHEMQMGLVACVNETGALPDSVGIDTWGVDFGVIDADGDLAFNPLHYRDACRDAVVPELSERIPYEQLFYNSGYNVIASVESLFYIWNKKPDVARNIKTILFTPDLLGFFLCGERYAERSICCTSKVFDVETGLWREDSLKAIGVDPSYFPKVVMPGTVVGKLRKELLSELGMNGDVSMVAVAGHDTTSAAAAVPSMEDRFAYISCGTWSIVGTKADKVIRTKEVFENGGSFDCSVNGGVDMRINIVGLWIQQECKRCWALKGENYSYPELTALAAEAEPFIAVIDPDDEIFFHPGDMIDNVKKYCSQTGQRVPQTVGEVNRVVTESLALKYRFTIDRIQSMLGVELPVVYMIGGGIQNKQLCQFTASACNRPVKAGPVEATVIGNFIMQALAMGAIRDLDHGREVIRNSCEVEQYEPIDAKAWEKQYEFARTLFKTIYK